MNKLTSIINKIKIGYQANKFDIAVILLVMLSVLLAVGVWRLKKARPEKEPIKVTHNISFVTARTIS